MGQVWLAQHKGLDIQVAVKFMRRDVADDPVSVARFEQEAKLVARIKSPHVVEVFDYDVTETGIPFIVMESLRGRDLETVLQNGRTLGISDTARVLVQVCKALSKAHALGVIHRDIKAENVFVVQEDGVPFVKVLDFGVAKETTAAGTGISLSGTTVGTPSYMSPEQLFHPKEIDLRTDLWATAVLVYRCLTGSFPFEGESFASVCLSVSKGKFATPSALNSVLPGGLDAWFKKAFHKSLDARFASAAEMSEAFLNELRKADLLPTWAETAEGVSSATSTQVSPRFSAGAARTGNAAPRMAFVLVGMALAALCFFQFAPLPARTMALAVAGQAGELARTWAVNEGLYPPALEIADDASSPQSFTRGADVGVIAPISFALAERDVPRLDRTGQTVAPRSPESTRLVVVRPAAFAIDAITTPIATSPDAAVPNASNASPTAAAPSTESAAQAGSTTSPTDLATIRFGL
jgi:serine/threonine-protein kinase